MLRRSPSPPRSRSVSGGAIFSKADTITSGVRSREHFTFLADTLLRHCVGIRLRGVGGLPSSARVHGDGDGSGSWARLAPLLLHPTSSCVAVWDASICSNLDIPDDDFFVSGVRNAHAMGLPLDWQRCRESVRRFVGDAHRSSTVLAYCVANNERLRRRDLSAAKLEQLGDVDVCIAAGIASLHRIIHFLLVDQEGASALPEGVVAPDRRHVTPVDTAQVRAVLYRGLANFLLRHLFSRVDCASGNGSGGGGGSNNNTDAAAASRSQGASRSRRLPVLSLAARTAALSSPAAAKGPPFRLFYVRRSILHTNVVVRPLPPAVSTRPAFDVMHELFSTLDGTLHDVATVFGYGPPPRDNSFGAPVSTIDVFMADMKELHVAVQCLPQGRGTAPALASQPQPQQRHFHLVGPLDALDHLQHCGGGLPRGCIGGIAHYGDAVPALCATIAFAVEALRLEIAGSQDAEVVTAAAPGAGAGGAHQTESWLSQAVSIAAQQQHQQRAAAAALMPPPWMSRRGRMEHLRAFGLSGAVVPPGESTVSSDPNVSTFSCASTGSLLAGDLQSHTTHSAEALAVLVRSISASTTDWRGRTTHQHAAVIERFTVAARDLDAVLEGLEGAPPAIDGQELFATMSAVQARCGHIGSTHAAPLREWITCAAVCVARRKELGDVTALAAAAFLARQPQQLIDVLPASTVALLRAVLGRWDVALATRVRGICARSGGLSGTRESLIASITEQRALIAATQTWIAGSACTEKGMG